MNKKIKGQNLRLGFKDKNEVLKYIAGALTFDLSIEVETEDSTNKDSTGDWKEVEAGSKSWSGSGQCDLLDDAEDLGAIQGWDLADLVGEKLEASFNEVEGAKNRETTTQRKYGRVLITSWKITSANKEGVKADFAFTGDGPLKNVPVIRGKKEVELNADGTFTAESYSISDGTILSAATDAPWLTVSVNAQNKVTFKPQAYEFAEEGDDPRYATVVLSSGHVIFKVKVSQRMKQLVPGPEISGETAIEVAPAGETVRRQYATSDGSKLKVLCDVEWLHASMVGNKLVLTADKYNYDEEAETRREGIITLTVQGTTSVFNITVGQDMADIPEPTIEGCTEIEAGFEAAEYVRQYQVSDGSALEASANVAWIHPVVGANNKVTVAVDAYDFVPKAADPRVGIVTLSIPETSSTLEVEISQVMGAQPAISGDATISIADEGGSVAKEYIASDASAIQAETDADWLSVSVNGNIVTVSAEKYPVSAEGANPRVAELRIFTETYAEKIVTVSQPMCATISGDEEIDFDHIGGVEVRQYASSDASAIHAASDAEWLTVSVDADNKVSFTAAAYPYTKDAADPRIANVALTTESGASLNVEVIQTMDAQPTISGDGSYEFDAEGGEKSGEYVASDESVINAACDAPWLNVAIEDGELTITAEAYPYSREGANPRTAVILLTTETGAEKSIAISQAKAASTIVGATEVELLATATAKYRQYQSSDGLQIEAEVEEGVDWLSVSVNANNRVTFTPTANEGEEREAEVTLSTAEGAELVVTVTQPVAE